jgi:splicing factor 3A subunit 1
MLLVLAVKTVRPPAPDELLISPLTGEKIPATKVQEHMRIGLLDPRWVEQRDRQIQDKINQETVYAPGICLSVCAVIWVPRTAVGCSLEVK